MITRVLAAGAAVALGFSLLWGAGPAQAVDPAFSWLGNSAGTVTATDPYFNSQVTLLTHDDSVLMAYQTLRGIQLLQGKNLPGADFTSFGFARWDNIVGKPRLDRASDGRVVLSFMSRESSGLGRIHVHVYDRNLSFLYSKQLSSSAKIDEGYDLSATSPSGIITVTYVFSTGSIIVVEYDGSTSVQQTLRSQDPSGSDVGSPRVVVGVNGVAAVIAEVRNADDPTIKTLRAWTRLPGRPIGSPYAALANSAYPGGVSHWDATLANDGTDVIVFIRQAGTASTRLISQRNDLPSFEPVGSQQVIDNGTAEGIRWLSAETRGLSTVTYFWNSITSAGGEAIETLTVTDTNPSPGVGQVMATSQAQSSSASQITGLDREGLPWLVWSRVTSVDPGTPQLHGVTSSFSPSNPSIVETRGAAVGNAPLGIRSADAVVLSNGYLLAAWVGIVDDRTVISTRWFGYPALPIAATNLAAEIVGDESVRLTWTNSEQVAGTFIATHEVRAFGPDGLPAARCEAQGAATECVFPIGTEPGMLAPGVTYGFQVGSTSQTGAQASSATLAEVTIPATPDPDPGPEPDPGPDPDPGPEPDPGPDPDPVAESIVISGSRGEVRGVRGIIVNGTTTGLVGEIVMPRIKFPGQTDYSDGVARRTVAADGTFTWERRTGKKIYIIFKTVDGSVQSAAIVIR